MYEVVSDGEYPADIILGIGILICEEDVILFVAGLDAPFVGGLVRLLLLLLPSFIPWTEWKWIGRDCDDADFF